MIGLELNRNALSDKGWVFYGDETKYTSNRKLIAEELDRIFKQKTWVELRYPGYRSPTTLILNVKKDEIELEEPPDWSDDQQTALIQYRVPGEPWHSFRVHVKHRAAGSIFFHFPDIYTITERRQYFRLEVPSESHAKIILKKKSASKNTRRRRNKLLLGSIRDISAGGMAIFPQTAPGLVMPGVHTMVGPIELDLRVDNKKRWPLLVIEKGEVVRMAETMVGDKKIMVMALKFHLSRKEEECLFNYIRERERAIIKTGVA